VPLKAVPEGGNTVSRCNAGIGLLVGLIHFDLPLDLQLWAMTVGSYCQ